MKKTLTLLSILICFAASAQQDTIPRPTTLPFRFGNFYNWSPGYLREDSGHFFAIRDTMWIPIRKGAMVFWENTGIDSTVWQWDGVRWKTFSGSGGGGGSGHQLVLAPIGSTPNANAMTLTDDSVLNVEPYNRAYGGVTTSNTTTPQYAQGQKGWYSSTDSIATWYGRTYNDTADYRRAAFYRTGVATWWITNGVSELGTLSYSTPDSLIGFVIKSAPVVDIRGDGRAQFRQYRDTGGISWGTTRTGRIPGNQVVLLNNGHFIISGFLDSLNNQVTDHGYMFDNYGTSYLADTVRLGKAPNGSAADSVLTISNTVVRKVSSDALGGGGIPPPGDSTQVLYAVLDSTCTVPGSPTTDDAYMVCGSPSGAWAGHGYDIATWNGGSWTFTDPNSGDYAQTADDKLSYIYRSGVWVRIGGIPLLVGGNRLGAQIRYGTIDAQHFNLITNNTLRFQVTSSGNYLFNNLTGADFALMRLNSSGQASRINLANTTGKYLNGYGAFVGLNTDSITEGSNNKFYTDARARSAISLTTTGSSGASTYNSSTGVLNVPTYSLAGIGSLDTVNVSNVLSFGADSTGGSDATAAFNNAIAQAVIDGKKKVYVPHGTYSITVAALKAGSQTNKQGIQLTSDIEIFGDGYRTIIRAKAQTTGDTATYNWYPVFNGFSAPSNVRIHDLKIDGNQDSIAIYVANPYTNPTGHNDTTKHYSVQGIYIKQSDNIKIWNVWADSCQGFGAEAYNVTNFNIDNSKFTYNGNGGVGYTSNTATTGGSSGVLSNSVLDANNSDNIRIINGTGKVTVENCQISNAKYYIGATNWFAGCYVAGRNVILKGNRVYGNSAYGLDVSYNAGGGDTSQNYGIVIDGNIIYNNANAGIAVNMNKAVITNNQIYNNGKTQGGLIDTASSSYDPAAIVGNNATDATIQNNISFDTAATPIQIWFVKKWAGSPTPSWSFKNSIINNNRIRAVADTTHAWQGNVGNNSIIYNVITNSSGVLIAPSSDSRVLTLTNGVPVWSTVPASTPSLTATQIAFGDGSNNMTSSANLTYASSSVTSLNSGIGTTSTNGLLIENQTAAAVGAQQYSPRIMLGGRGWKTNATAASQSVYGYIEERAVQDAANPISQLTLASLTNVTATTTNTPPHTFALGSNGVAVFNTSATGSTVRINGALSLNAGASVSSGVLTTSMLDIGSSAASASTLTSLVNITTGFANTAASTGIKLLSILTVTNPSGSGTWYGANIMPVVSGNSYSTAPAEMIGVRGAIQYQQGSGTVFPSLIGVDGGIEFVSSNANTNVTEANAFRARVIETSGTGTPSGKLVTFTSYKADSIDNKFYSTNNYGFLQKGTNAINFFAAPTIHGWTATGITSNGSTLQVNGSASFGYVSKAIDYTATAADYVIEETGTTKTITLPTAVGITGRIYTVKLTASSTATIATTSSQTIDGSTTYSLSAQYKYCSVVSNGSNWIVIANN